MDGLTELDGAKRMLPTQCSEPTEIGIGSDHRAPALKRDRSVLSVDYQFARSSGIAAKPVKDGEVAGAGTHDSGGEGSLSVRGPKLREAALQMGGIRPILLSRR